MLAEQMRSEVTNETRRLFGINRKSDFLQGRYGRAENPGNSEEAPAWAEERPSGAREECQYRRNSPKVIKRRLNGRREPKLQVEALRETLRENILLPFHFRKILRKFPSLCFRGRRKKPACSGEA